MKKRTKILLIFLGIFLLLIAVGVGALIYVESNLTPTDEFIRGKICGEGAESCEVTPFVVDEGAYGLTTLEKLEEQGIIYDAKIVYYWNRIMGGYSFYAGYYEIPHTFNGYEANLDDLLGYLSNPNNAIEDTVIIKLDEGDFVRSFAYEIASNITLKENPTGTDYEKSQTLLNYWNNTEVLKGYINDYPFLTEDIFNSEAKQYLEGYLFPDTYEFFEFSSCDQITRKLLDRTLEIFEKYESDIKESKLSIHEIFTLASIVQWETGDPEDSKLVAGAFLNRIDNPEHEWTGGKFQSTVTACYAFDLDKDECDNIGDTTQITEQYSPYNTYTVEGFPPGPVCNPNEVALLAAIYPDQEAGYYFFVADMCNGGTAFARTYAEHNANINRYYLPCAE